MTRLKAKKIIDAINKGISINPTTFTVEHIEKILVDGAFENNKSTITYSGIVYLEDSSTQINIDSKTAGTSYSTNRYKMLLNNENNIKVDPKNLITFESKEGRFEIQAAYPIVIEDTICGYMCDLKRVD
ncbi:MULTISPECIES: hypothetical protein [unclassified Clostridium]|uniref:hypothetical protein n=1 Tax=unclassified Clostridium TaxID=2614128 RepID=UPI002079A188|nr:MULTISPECIES: hypothetical protein [unclassified Clostridium]